MYLSPQHEPFASKTAQLEDPWQFPGIGEFQCYDPHARRSLQRAAEKARVPWTEPPKPEVTGNGTPPTMRLFFFQRILCRGGGGGGKGETKPGDSLCLGGEKGKPNWGFIRLCFFLRGSLLGCLRGSQIGWGGGGSYFSDTREQF